MKVKDKSLEYEKIIGNRLPTSTLDTARRIKEEWVFDEFAIVRFTDKTSGLRTFKRIERGKRQNPELEIVKSDKHFIMLFDTALEALENEVINFNEYAILMATANMIDWHDNRYVVDRVSGVKLTILGFSKKIHKDNDYVTKQLKSLNDKGFIKLEKTGNATYILVNVSVAYKGKLDKVTIPMVALKGEQVTK